MNSPAYDIKDILVANTGLGLTLGTNLFVNREPTKPDDCVTIFDYFGGNTILTFEGSSYEYTGVQIMVRNKKQSEAWEQINSIYSLLHSQAHVSCNGTVYELIKASGSPMLLDWDDNDRCRLIVNFNIQRRF